MRVVEDELLRAVELDRVAVVVASEGEHDVRVAGEVQVQHEGVHHRSHRELEGAAHAREARILQHLQSLPEARLWIAGGGDERLRLERLARGVGMADADAEVIVDGATGRLVPFGYSHFRQDLLKAPRPGVRFLWTPVTGFARLGP